CSESMPSPRAPNVRLGSIASKTIEMSEHSLSGMRWWSQRVDATLYPERERWSVRQCVEVIFEALRHQRRQSFGIAGSGASRLKGLGERLVSHHRQFIFSWPHTGEFVPRHGAAQGWH